MKKDVHIAILGFGIEGKSLLKYFLSKNYTNITICDKKETLDENSEEPLISQKPRAKIQTKLGKNYLKNLESFDIIFRSPGISCLIPEIVEAKHRGQNVTSLTRYFFDHCPCPIIGVTGTKGKGTTSTLIYKIFKKAGRDVYLGGNIGDPPLDFLEKLKKTSLVVLELSSFQLQDITKSPHIAVILNVTSDHLDYHGSLKEYHEAKEGLVAFQKENDYLVVNEDYEKSFFYGSKTNARTFTVSRNHAVNRGAYIKNSAIFLTEQAFLNIQPKNMQPQKETKSAQKTLKKTTQAKALKSSQNFYSLMNIHEVGLIGTHNLENILPAITVAAILGISSDDIRKAVREFRGLPHRLEFVAEKNGVKYFNDSFSTTPETTIAAINSFTTPIILIVGGSEKYSDFGTLAEKIVNAHHIKKVIFLGNESAKRIEKAISLANKKNVPLVFGYAMSMNEALRVARADAKMGDTVLLSPACASFDLFNNYKERGDIFKNLAKKVPAKSIAKINLSSIAV